MEAETRRILDIVDEALSKQDQASKELATIFSATRGPDDEKSSIYDGELVSPKAATMIVRMQAFPLSCRHTSSEVELLHRSSVWAILDHDIPAKLKDSIIAKGGRHFRNHVTLALEVLGWTIRTDDDGTTWHKEQSDAPPV